MMYDVDVCVWVHVYMCMYVYVCVCVCVSACVCVIKTHGSESGGQEEATCTRVFWPMRPLQ